MSDTPPGDTLKSAKEILKASHKRYLLLGFALLFTWFTGIQPSINKVTVALADLTNKFFELERISHTVESIRETVNLSRSDTVEINRRIRASGSSLEEILQVFRLQQKIYRNTFIQLQLANVLNTHAITQRKFKKQIDQLIEDIGNPIAFKYGEFQFSIPLNLSLIVWTLLCFVLFLDIRKTRTMIYLIIGQSLGDRVTGSEHLTRQGSRSSGTLLETMNESAFWLAPLPAPSSSHESEFQDLRSMIGWRSNYFLLTFVNILFLVLLLFIQVYSGYVSFCLGEIKDALHLVSSPSGVVDRIHFQDCLTAIQVCAIAVSVAVVFDLAVTATRTSESMTKRVDQERRNAALIALGVSGACLAMVATYPLFRSELRWNIGLSSPSTWYRRRARRRIHISEFSRGIYRNPITRALHFVPRNRNPTITNAHAGIGRMKKISPGELALISPTRLLAVESGLELAVLQLWRSGDTVGAVNLLWNCVSHNLDQVIVGPAKSLETQPVVLRLRLLDLLAGICVRSQQNDVLQQLMAKCVETNNRLASGTQIPSKYLPANTTVPPLSSGRESREIVARLEKWRDPSNRWHRHWLAQSPVKWLWFDGPDLTVEWL